eukprot:8411_1
MSTVYRSQETEKRWKQQYGLDLDALRNMSVTDAKKWWNDNNCVKTLGGMGRKVCSVNPTHNFTPHRFSSRCTRKNCDGTLSLKLHDKKDKDKFTAYYATYRYILHKKEYSTKTSADKQKKNEKKKNEYHSNIEKNRAKQRRRYRNKKG